jgi:hypothetical protein
VSEQKPPRKNADSATLSHSSGVTFGDFLSGLTFAKPRATPSDKAKAGGEKLRQDASEAANAIVALPTVDRASLAELIRGNPTWFPMLGSCVGLGQEQLKRQLHHQVGGSGWITAARKNPAVLIDFLDERFGLVTAIQEQRGRGWTFADVLVERVMWSQRSGSSAVTVGRGLEDIVEGVIKDLGLPYDMRKRFTGRDGRTGPCDFAIPGPLDKAQIVGAVKGFDSTGSKLTAAWKEIEDMAQVRLPTQFVFAFIDGIGWRGRQADLRRIFELWSRNLIDGLYSRARLDEFRRDLEEAARLRRLL